MDSFTPSVSSTLPQETASSATPFYMMPFSVKRRRSDSMPEDTTVDSISDGSLSDSSTSSHKRCFIDLPAAYLAVQNLLCSSDSLATDVQAHLFFTAKGSNKNEFRKTVARCQFFKFFTEAEFDLLWKEMKSLHPSSRGRVNHLTDLQVAEFFERRFQEVENVCMIDWQAPTLKSSRLYIPGQLNDFHLTSIFENQMKRHRPEGLGFNQTLDFIIKKVRAENWQHLITASVAELSYCPPLQVEQLIIECAEKDFSDLVLLILANNPHRSISILNELSEYSRRKSEPAFIENIAGLFVPWLFSLPEPILLSKMKENNLGALDKKLLDYWARKSFSRYIRQAAIQKETLKNQEKIYIDSQPYTEALKFFKNMLVFLEHTIIWAGRQDEQSELLELALGWLKSSPLLIGGLQPENQALVARAVLKDQLSAQAPLPVIMDLLTSLHYFDYRSSSYEATNEVWRSFLTYWYAMRPTTEQLKEQISALVSKFRNVSDLHNLPYKDDPEETTLLEMFSKTFETYPEICTLPEYQALLHHFLTNNFQLLHSTTGALECSKISYKTLEIFLNLLAQAYEYAPAEKKQQYLNYLMSQSFMSQHAGLCAVYMILTRTMAQSPGPLESSFCGQFIVAMAKPSFLSRVSLDTAVGFLKAYESYIASIDSVEANGRAAVLAIAEKIITKNDNPLLSNYLKSIYGLTATQSPLLFSAQRALSPINIHVLPRSYKPGQQTRVIYNMPESVFVKMK